MARQHSIILSTSSVLKKAVLCLAVVQDEEESRWNVDDFPSLASDTLYIAYVRYTNRGCYGKREAHINESMGLPK